MVCEVKNIHFMELMELYKQLHDNTLPEKNTQTMDLWNEILENKDYHIIIARENEKIVSSCVCVIVPNLTHNQRPYALIENVIR